MVRLFALAVAGVLLAARPAVAAPTDEDTQRARAAFAAGKAAAAQEQWAEAIEQFELAMSIRPAASIHYNVAVCHHNLMLAVAQDPVRADKERRAAVDAYVAYLDASPDASDRASVQAAIEQLGGRPHDDEWVIQRIEPDTATPPPALRDDDTDTDDGTGGTDTRPVTTGPPPAADFPLGRIGPFFPMTIASPRDLSRSNVMRTLPGIGLGVRGGAFVTRTRRLNVGGEFMMTGQPVSLSSDVSLVTAALSFVTEYAAPIGTPKFELGGGAGLGIGVQSLRYRGTAPVSCPISGQTLSTRGGLLAQARFVAAGALGNNDRHELALRISPGVAFFSEGARSKDEDMMCPDLDDGYTAVGLGSRAALVVTIDLGYAPRF